MKSLVKKEKRKRRLAMVHRDFFFLSLLNWDFLHSFSTELKHRNGPLLTHSSSIAVILVLLQGKD
jgi:hypothetical protein